MSKYLKILNMMKSFGRDASLYEMICEFLLYENCKCIKHRILYGLTDKDKVW